MKFAKMHGLGNDFIIFDGINKELPELDKLAIKVCNRHFGIGADGMIVIEESEKADIKMTFYNEDGSQPQMCGNGIRCFAKYIYDNNYIDKKEFSVETLAGIVKPKVFLEDGIVNKVEVNMGKPIVLTKDIPIIFDKETVMEENIEVDENKYNISFLMMGCPHTVIFVNDLKGINIEKEGPAIEKHNIFPEGTNVNFCKIIDDNSVEVLTWERGVGQTLACGTGASAVGVIVSSLYNTKGKLSIHLLGGIAEVEVKEDEVYLIGPAELICEGEYYF